MQSLAAAHVESGLRSEALARAGASVAICGQDDSLGNAVTQLANGSKSKVVGKAADVRSSTEVMQLFQLVDRELGGVDAVVNNTEIGVFRASLN